jgi:undecaprenyl-diphosphatase
VSIGLVDYICSGLMKPYFQRLRPCHEPRLSNLVFTLGHCGGKFGFASSHAATSMALATCYIQNIKIKALQVALVIWAILVASSRVYLGVHYFTDIFVGGCIGFAITFVIFTSLKTKFLK